MPFVNLLHLICFKYQRKGKDVNGLIRQQIKLNEWKAWDFQQYFHFESRYTPNQNLWLSGFMPFWLFVLFEFLKCIIFLISSAQSTDVLNKLCLQLYDIRAMKELESFRGHRKDVTSKSCFFCWKRLKGLNIELG